VAGAGSPGLAGRPLPQEGSLADPDADGRGDADGRVTSNLHAVRAVTGLRVGVGRPGGLRVWA